MCDSKIYLDCINVKQLHVTGETVGNSMYDNMHTVMYNMLMDLMAYVICCED